MAVASGSGVRRVARVIVVSGPSGAGKGTLIANVRRRMPHLAVAVSATTRAIRDGEVDGREYHFLTPDEFARRVEAGEFVEHVEYAGNRYGTLRSELERILGGGDSVVLEIELRGAREVRSAMPGCLTVFVKPPSLDELERRLRARATESDAAISARLETSRIEMAAIDEFDAVVNNADVDVATDALYRIIDDATRG
ncbi:MAG: guanylate kinase [Thermoleophilia bacterium]|nr:guanylate kinase [Thermoleophilia bacterium]